MAEEGAMEVQRGRFTADIDGDFVIFLIGMRFNHPLRIRKWWPVATAMPRMLKVLSQHPELGCLGFQQWFGRTTILVQYWRDFDSLDRFAKDRDLPHLEPWRRFNRAVRASGDVGIWHETFKIRPASTRPSTATCRSSAWRQLPGTCPPPRRPTPQPPALAPAQQTSRLSSHTEARGPLNAVRPRATHFRRCRSRP
jgi:Domain of unknown function (DUF4188)